MARIICHHNGKYNIYSSIADGFLYERGLTKDELEQAIQEELGRRGLDDLPRRLERAHQTGHSSMEGGSLEEFLHCNRAGDNEEHLSVDECIRRFIS